MPEDRAIADRNHRLGDVLLITNPHAQSAAEQHDLHRFSLRSVSQNFAGMYRRCPSKVARQFARLLQPLNVTDAQVT
jgi:hypothetical protein